MLAVLEPHDRSEQPDDRDRHKSDQRGEDEQREIYAREEHEGCHLAPTGSDPAREFPDSTSATDGDRLVHAGDREPESSERRLETTILGGAAHQQDLIGVETAKGILDGEYGIDIAGLALDLRFIGEEPLALERAHLGLRAGTVFIGGKPRQQPGAGRGDDADMWWPVATLRDRLP